MSTSRSADLVASGVRSGVGRPHLVQQFLRVALREVTEVQRVADGSDLGAEVDDEFRLLPLDGHDRQRLPAATAHRYPGCLAARDDRKVAVSHGHLDEGRKVPTLVDIHVLVVGPDVISGRNAVSGEVKAHRSRLPRTTQRTRTYGQFGALVSARERGLRALVTCSFALALGAPPCRRGRRRTISGVGLEEDAQRLREERAQRRQWQEQAEAEHARRKAEAIAAFEALVEEFLVAMRRRRLPGRGRAPHPICYGHQGPTVREWVRVHGWTRPSGWGLRLETKWGQSDGTSYFLTDEGQWYREDDDRVRERTVLVAEAEPPYDQIDEVRTELTKLLATFIDC